MLSELRVGPIVSADGTVNPGRASKDGAFIIGAGLADYEEIATRGQVFTGANQGPGGTTTTVALATTYTGLVLSNPVNSGVNLVMMQLGIAVVGAPAALSTIGLLAGFAQGGITVHTTPLTPFGGLVGNSGGLGKLDAAATLVGTPYLLMPLGVTPITGATAQPVNPLVLLNVYDIKGAVVVPPGGYVGLYTSTVLSVIAGFTWREKAIAL